MKLSFGRQACAAFSLMLGALLAGGCDCGDGSAADSGSDAADVADSGAPWRTRVFYRPSIPAASDNPFPGDYLTTPDGNTATGARLAIPDARAFPYAEQLNTLDGFGIVFGASLRTTRALDPASVGPTSFEIYRYEPSGSGSVAPEPVSLRDAGDPRTLHLLPVNPLAPGQQYLVVARRGLLDFEGTEVGPSEGWEEALASGAAAAVLAVLERAGVDAAEVLHAHVFTTGTAVRDLSAVHDSLVAGSAPVVTVVEAFPPRDAAGDLHPALLARLPPTAPDFDLDLDLVETDDIGVVVYGTVETTEYRDGDSYWTIDSFAPVPRGVLTLDWLMTLPAGATGPVPVVVFSHALGVCKETLLAIADKLAEYGVGTIGIDAVAHGSRIPGGGVCGKDVSFFDVLDPFDLLASRDVFRQTISDHLHVVRFLTDPAGGGIDVLPWNGDLVSSGDGIPDLATGPTAVIGQSMGSALGAVTAALDPDVAGAVLNVAAHSFLGVLPAGLAGGFTLETLFAMVTLLEPGDASAYVRAYVEPPGAPGATVPTSVLIQMAVNDSVVANDSTLDLARLVGAPLVTPAPAAVSEFGTGTVPSPVQAASSPTLGLWAFDGVAHEFLLLPEDLANPGATLLAQIQAAAFVWSTVDPGFTTPVIIDPADAAQVSTFRP